MSIYGVKGQPNKKFLDWSEFKGFANHKMNFNFQTKFLFGMCRKHCRKSRKCWLPTFSPFPTMFSEGLFFKVIESRDCAVKGQPFHERAVLYSFKFLTPVDNTF